MKKQKGENGKKRNTRNPLDNYLDELEKYDEGTPSKDVDAED